MKSKVELNVIIPVYNEEEIIDFVIESWIKTLRKSQINFVINVYNDGSNDNTLGKLLNLSKKYSEINAIDKPNTGHGPTILKGYKEANSEWIFQVDSDNEIEARYFNILWENKKKYDFILGRRENRNNPFSRKIISFISRITIWLLYGRGIYDVNSPYRLFKKKKLSKEIIEIPDNTFAPNVIISGIVCNKKLKVLEIPIPSQGRKTGETSIKKFKLFKSAWISWIQTILFSFHQKF